MHSMVGNVVHVHVLHYLPYYACVMHRFTQDGKLFCAKAHLAAFLQHTCTKDSFCIYGYLKRSSIQQSKLEAFTKKCGHHPQTTKHSDTRLAVSLQSNFYINSFINISIIVELCKL